MWHIKFVKSYLLLYEWYIIDIKSEMVFFAFYYNLKCLKLELTIYNLPMAFFIRKIIRYFCNSFLVSALLEFK
jgi:hypothetical protein